MIRFESVYKRYPNGRDALASVSFRLEQGEMAFLTGPSGAGKSTMANLILKRRFNFQVQQLVKSWY